MPYYRVLEYQEPKKNKRVIIEFSFDSNEEMQRSYNSSPAKRFISGIKEKSYFYDITSLSDIQKKYLFSSMKIVLGED